MPCYISVAAILLAVCTTVTPNPDRNVDCRKFVFAPLCRGVAAKRAHFSHGPIQHGVILDEASLTELLRNFNIVTDVPPSEEKEDDSLRKSSMHEEQTENSSFKKDKLHPDHFLYTLFLGNKRKNNDVDNSPLYEYENL